MPKRSRSGVVSRPVLVVAPTRVNGGRSSVSVRAAGPCPTTMSRRKSSSAGYRISSIARLSRWISSTNSTSCRSRPVRIAAMSPLRSSAGPATQRMPTPSSSRTMYARLVFPRPGGPTSRTWSNASSRAFAAAKARDEALDHVLLVGPPGLGKTSLAYIVREELGVGIRCVAGPALERKGDMAAILTGLERHDVLFVRRSARILGVEIGDDAADEIARRSRGTPRIANRILKRVRDVAQVRHDGSITTSVAQEALTLLEVDG